MDTTWNTDKLKEDCKSAIIISVLNPNKSSKDPKNYWSIALTSIACKVTKRTVLGIIKYLLKTNLYTAEQASFKWGHSTNYQVLSFTHTVKDNMNKFPTTAAFLDLIHL
jgi:hypothetical protein